jgi:hypothetical protein
LDAPGIANLQRCYHFKDQLGSTNSVQVLRIVGFTSDQIKLKTGWRPEWDGSSRAPDPFFFLTFYDGNVYRGNFGVGINFFAYHNAEAGYKVRYVTNDELKELLNLIAITEEEFSYLREERLKPGPWKK